MTDAAIIEGRKHALRHLGRVLILGLGMSGRASADYLIDLLGTRVEGVLVAAGAPNADAEEWAQSARKRGALVEFGLERFDGLSFDLCIASPGISEFSDFYQSAREVSAEVISEVEFAWRESRGDARWVAITGTNGKTTTTALLAHVLASAGLSARAVGNIGDTCIDAVAADATSVYVAEVSSYQLASTRLFAPDVALVLNITPDHLSWHRTYEGYIDAKWKVLANMCSTSGSWAVLDATDVEVRSKIREIRSLSRAERGFDYVPLGTSEGIAGDMRLACGSDHAAFVRDGVLCVAIEGREREACRVDDLQIKGSHNVSNALAAATAALLLGLEEDDIGSALATFAPLEHRLEPCGQIAGVACFNDSKATNVDSVLKALTAFEGVRPVIMLGGRDKGTDLTSLVRACELNVKAAVLYGESRDRFVRAFADAEIEIALARNMEEALDAALGLSSEGDVVLLSPACSSFDEFASYEERGRVFKSLVSRRSHPAMDGEAPDSMGVEAWA